MFISVQFDEIFDPTKAPTSEVCPAYWLAQLRKADWQYLLNFVDVKLPMKTRKQAMAEAALQHFKFVTCIERGDVWQLWAEHQKTRRLLVIQFRHSETDWSHGVPEFIHLENNDPLGLVNIAGRLLCRVN